MQVLHFFSMCPYWSHNSPIHILYSLLIGNYSSFSKSNKLFFSKAFHVLSPCRPCPNLSTNLRNQQIASIFHPLSTNLVGCPKYVFSLQHMVNYSFTLKLAQSGYQLYCDIWLPSAFTSLINHILCSRDFTEEGLEEYEITISSLSFQS